MKNLENPHLQFFPHKMANSIIFLMEFRVYLINNQNAGIFGAVNFFESVFHHRNCLFRYSLIGTQEEIDEAAENLVESVDKLVRANEAQQLQPF